MPHRGVSQFLYLLVIIILSYHEGATTSCYFSTHARAGELICTLVLDGYDMELLKASGQFVLQDGNLYLADDEEVQGFEETTVFDLPIRVSKEDCQWLTSVQVITIQPENMRTHTPQRYSLWPECIPGVHQNQQDLTRARQSHSRSRRQVCDDDTCNLQWIMTEDPYIAVVPSDAPNDACIYTLTADSATGSLVSYHLRTASEEAIGRFRVDESSGCVLTVVSPNEVYEVPAGNGEGDADFVLSVYAKSSTDEQLNAEVNVFVDYHVPQFSQSVYEAVVMENVNSQIVTTVEALSFNIKWAVSYSIQSGTYLESQQIDPVDGTIRLDTSLDRESDSPYYLIVAATDAGGTGLARVNVVIGDDNDCTPTFNQSAYFITIPEDYEGIIANFSATDCDEGANAELIYLTDSEEDFTLDSDGSLYPIPGVLDADLGSANYPIEVEAVDSGSPPRVGSTYVVVQVTPVNDESPEFVPDEYSYIIDENIDGSLDFGAVCARDADSGDSLAFTVDRNCYFDIDRTTGVVSFNGKVNRDEYSCIVTATDESGNEKDTVSFVVTVNDINDNQPVFANCPSTALTVPENATDGLPVTQVTATDDDRGLNGKVSYRLEPTDTPFAVDSTTGEITVKRAKNLDRESTPSYVLTVVATDRSPNVPQLQGFCDIVVDVSDVNDEYPEFQLQEYSTLISDDINTGDEVIDVIAEDPDTGTRLVYSIPDNAYFNIYPNTGTIVYKYFGDDKPTSGTYTVTASDGVWASEVDVNINVGDSPGPAPDWGQMVINSDSPVPEDTPIGTTVVTISASGSGNALLFQLLRGARPETNSLNSFDLQNDDDFRGATINVGQGGLDYETVQQVRLQIVVGTSAGDSLQSKAELVILIGDVNDEPPTFLLDVYTASVPEGLTGSELPADVTTLTATDLDVTPEFREVIYNISSCDGCEEEEFKIDEDTGTVTALKTFDRESNNSVYTLNVAATQLATAVSVTTTLSVYVLDTNDFTPQILQSTATINVPEDTIVGSVIQHFFVVDDQDVESVLQYYIIDEVGDGGSGNRAGIFSVDSATGVITLISPLDYEDVQRYTITFFVNDGLGSSNRSITVNVLNVDDEPPVLSAQSGCSVPENTLPTEPVCEVSFSDEDCTGPCTVTYSILVGNEFFTIDADGNIYATVEFDREEADSLHLAVTAEDQSGNIGLTEVVIEVTDVNDNPPAFTDAEYVRYIEENTVGVIAVPVAVHDPDENPSLTYEVNDTARFSIDNSGVLTVKIPFDREVTGSVPVEVCATETGYPTVCTAVNVVIMDVNDERPSNLRMIYPTDSPSSVTIDLPETTSVGETVAIFQVSDPDVDFRQAVVFSFSVANSRYDIYSDPYTLQGVVTLAQQVNCDSSDVCDSDSLTVQVTDGNGFPLTLQFGVNWTEAGEPPSITVDRELSIEEPSTKVGSVTACDDDGDLIILSIDPSSDRDDEFGLTGSSQNSSCITRQLELLEASDRETISEYTLVIVAASGEDTVSQTILVIIEDADDEAPYFADPYTGVIDPTDDGQQWVAVVSATDDDLTDATFTYELVDNFNSLFRLDVNENNTATIYKQNGREPSVDEYQLSIRLEDKPASPNVGTGTVLVNVYRNVNPHTPKAKTMTVYSFEGSIPTTVIGTVPYSDEDLVDDKTFVAATDMPGNFFLNEQTGEITISESTPAGTYSMQFTVMDDKYDQSFVTWGSDQTSDVTVFVERVSRAQVESSGSIQFPEVNPLTFLSTYYDRFIDDLSTILGFAADTIEVFSVLSDGGDGTNVRYSVFVDEASSSSRKRRAVSVSATSTGIQSAEYLDMTVLRAVSDGSLSGLTVGMIPVDACTPNPCYSDCTSVLTIDTTPVTINADAASLVSVNAYESHECSCAVRSTPIGGCLSNTCSNGGTCRSLINGDVGYECDCPDGFDGPECQLLSRSFTNGYAWFEALTQCDESHTSLQVLTTSSSGILFYAGHMDETDPADFVLLELEDGLPKLTLKLSDEAGGQIGLTLQSAVDDGDWHMLDIYRNESYIEMVVDSCESLDYTEDHSKSVVESGAACSVSSTIDLFDRRFDSVRPLQLGGVEQGAGWDYDGAVPTSNQFDGCIRNFIQDGQLFDLAATDVYVGSEPGCTDSQATCLEGDAACVSGTCDITTSECVCDPLWTGSTCDEELAEYDFAEDSYVTYDLPGAPNPKVSDYYVMIRTRQDSGVIWTIRNDNTYEHITMELVDGYLQASWHLGDTTVTDSLPDYPLDNGEWHSISYQRTNNYVTIKIDGGGSVRELSNSESKFRELNMDTTSLQVGARLVREVVVLKNMLGCSADVRLNNEYLGFLPGTGSVSSSQGVTDGCRSDACLDDPCQNASAGRCVDLWRDYECRQDLPIAVIDALLILSTEAIIAIICCILLLILLLLIACIWSRRLEKTNEKRLLFIDEESVAEGDLTRFDEEGGGEMDDDGYDPTPFMRPLVPAETRPAEEMVSPAEEAVVRPVEEATVQAERVVPVKSAVTFQPSVGDYLHDRIHDEDQRSENGPLDSTHQYQNEGAGSSAGSLSSLNSSSTEGSQNFEFLQGYGPPFQRLADMYGNDGDTPGSVRLSYSSAEA